MVGDELEGVLVTNKLHNHKGGILKEITKIEKLNEVWSDAWDKEDIFQEIGTLKRDHTRAYVLKYLPRNGVHIEAGFGFGRYIFYLSDLGFNIVGIDVSKKG